MQVTTRWQRFGSVKDTNVVEAQKATAEDMFPQQVLAVDPPREVQQQLLKCSRQKQSIPAARRPGILVNTPAGPRMNGRIDVAEIPFVSGNLTVGVHVPFTEKQQQLVSGEQTINVRHRDHMEGEIPGCIPWILPLVGHRDDVPVEQVWPVSVTNLPPGLRDRRHVRVTLDPVLHHVVVKLLGPQQPGVGLSQNWFGNIRNAGRNLLRVPGICFGNASLKNALKAVAKNLLRWLMKIPQS